MIALTVSSKTYQQIVIAVSGFTGGFVNVDVQYSTRPDFQFGLAPLIIDVAPTAGAVTIDRLNQRTTYFIRMRERNGAAVGGWTEPLPVYTPSNIAQVTVPGAVLTSPALIVVPEYISAWGADNAQPGHPAANLSTDAPADQWWSAYATPGFSFEMVTGGSPVDTVALLATNACAASTIRVKGGASYANVRGGAPTFDSGSLAFHASANMGGRPSYHALVRLGSIQTHTHWRVEIGGNAPLAMFAATYAMIGLARTAKNMANEKTETPMDLGSIDRSRDGVPDRRPGFRMRKVDFDIAMMTEAQWETQFAELGRIIGLTTPALVVPNSRIGAFLHDRLLFGPITAQRSTNPRAPLFTKTLSVESLI